MPRNICLAFGPFGSLFLLTSSVSADWVVCLYIIARLLFIQQPGNTHGIYQSRRDRANLLDSIFSPFSIDPANLRLYSHELVFMKTTPTSESANLRQAPERGATMNGAEILVAALEREGVDVIFAYP